jgi:hypothetical protein
MRVCGYVGLRGAWNMRVGRGNVVKLNLVLGIVIPAKAGIQRRKSLKTLDPCLRRDDT